MSYFDGLISEKVWLKEANARLPTPSGLLAVPGFEHYVWDAVGGVLLCEAHRDRCNRQHKRRVVRLKVKAGCKGWTVRRLGVGCWLGLATLKKMVG
jgi:hypothetical protein